MKGALYNYKYRLSLMIKHPDADLSGVPAELGLPFKTLIKKGDPRISTHGRTFGAYPQSRCDFEFEPLASLPEGLRFAVEALTPHREYLTRLSDDGAKLKFFVGIFSEGMNTQEALDWTLLKEITDLHISLDLDFYGPDKNSPTPKENSDGAQG